MYESYKSQLAHCFIKSTKGIQTVPLKAFNQGQDYIVSFQHRTTTIIKPFS